MFHFIFNLFCKLLFLLSRSQTANLRKLFLYVTLLFSPAIASANCVDFKLIFANSGSQGGFFFNVENVLPSGSSSSDFNTAPKRQALVDRMRNNYTAHSIFTTISPLEAIDVPANTPAGICFDTTVPYLFFGFDRQTITVSVRRDNPALGPNGLDWFEFITNPLERGGLCFASYHQCVSGVNCQGYSINGLGFGPQVCNSAWAAENITVHDDSPPFREVVPPTEEEISDLYYADLFGNAEDSTISECGDISATTQVLLNMFTAAQEAFAALQAVQALAPGLAGNPTGLDYIQQWNRDLIAAQAAYGQALNNFRIQLAQTIEQLPELSSEQLDDLIAQGHDISNEIDTAQYLVDSGIPFELPATYQSNLSNPLNFGPDNQPDELNEAFRNGIIAAVGLLGEESARPAESIDLAETSQGALDAAWMDYIGTVCQVLNMQDQADQVQADLDSFNEAEDAWHQWAQDQQGDWFESCIGFTSDDDQFVSGGGSGSEFIPCNSNGSLSLSGVRGGNEEDCFEEIHRVDYLDSEWKWVKTWAHPTKSRFDSKQFILRFLDESYIDSFDPDGKSLFEVIAELHDLVEAGVVEIVARDGEVFISEDEIKTFVVRQWDDCINCYGRNLRFTRDGTFDENDIVFISEMYSSVLGSNGLGAIAQNIGPIIPKVIIWDDSRTKSFNTRPEPTTHSQRLYTFSDQINKILLIHPNLSGSGIGSKYFMNMSNFMDAIHLASYTVKQYEVGHKQAHPESTESLSFLINVMSVREFGGLVNAELAFNSVMFDVYETNLARGAHYYNLIYSPYFSEVTYAYESQIKSLCNDVDCQTKLFSDPFTSVVTDEYHASVFVIPTAYVMRYARGDASIEIDQNLADQIFRP